MLVGPFMVPKIMTRRDSKSRQASRNAQGCHRGRRIDSAHFEISGRRETEIAYLLFDGDKELWLPKSLGVWDGRSEIMQVPEWFAHKEGLI
jgi:hypothetical protein